MFCFLYFHFVCVDTPDVPKAAATDKTKGISPSVRDEQVPGGGEGLSVGPRCVFRQSVAEHRRTR